MAVWYCVPSKRPPEEANKCLSKWRDMGYKIALWRDEPDDPPYCNLITTGTYPGYASAVNYLALSTLELHPDCDWIVTGGDDLDPDAAHSADEIARQCSEYFLELHNDKAGDTEHSLGSTFGVMQPTGDRWGDKPGRAYADHVCGSPWMGREFCLRINQGRGPLWPDYFHMFVDEELFNVANKYGVLWQRRDLIHMHNHWARPRGDSADMPEWLKGVSGPEHWNKYKSLFEKRKAEGFPGSEPL